MKSIGCTLIIFIGLGISSAFTAATDGFSNPKRIDFSPDHPAVPGEILVKFKPATFKGNLIQVNGTVQTSQASINALFTQLQVGVMTSVFHSARSPLGDIYRLRFEAPISLSDALEQMAGDPNVEWVEPNYLYFISATPNDPYYLPPHQQQWGLQKIQAEQAWDISQGDPNTVIAIIDTGVDYIHPDLEDNIWHNLGEIPNDGVDDDSNGYVDDYIGWDFVSITTDGYSGDDGTEDMGARDNDPMDFHGHGTHCAGIASATTDNGIGIAGTAWNCKIMAIRAGYKTTDGDGVLASSDSAKALEYAADNGAHVISMSWGESVPVSTVQTAIDYAYSRGCILVGAAGNSGVSLQLYPAAYSNVIAVAASDEDDNRAPFSNYGSWVDIAAPGRSILSTHYDHTNAATPHRYRYISGTSMATPFVAGVAGLMLAQVPILAAHTVTQRLLDSADDIPWDDGPTKRLNAYQALLLNTTIIAINTPSSGENIAGGSSYNITWQTIGADIHHIHLLYSQDSEGNSHQNIIANTDDTGMYPWNPVPSINSSTVRVKAIAEDASNNPLAEDITGDFTIDSTPPTTPVVTDDGDLTNSTTQLHALWTASADLESGVAEYQYDIGTEVDGADLDDWTTVSANTEVIAENLALQPGEVYYIGVRAKNGAGLFSETGISDGITVNAPPVVSIPDVDFPEDGSRTIDLDNYVNDLNNADSEIVWTYAGNTYISVDASLIVHEVTFAAPLNWNGNENITFTATDPGGLSDSGSMKVTVTPVNDPPTASNLMITPLSPGLGDDLLASYDYDDIEEDQEGDSQIKWYRDGVHQESYDNINPLPSSATSSGEEWHFTVTPSDGIAFGDEETSLVVTIAEPEQRTLHLYPGWNLISICLDVTNTTSTGLLSVLEPIEGLYRSVWAYSAGNWKRHIYGGSDSLNDLKTIVHRKGYWIYMDSKATLTVTGEYITDTTIQLSRGWNLVGYNSPTARLRENALLSIATKYTSIWTYDNGMTGGTWLGYAVSVPNSFNNLDRLEPEKGYWIYVEEDCEWILP